MSDWFELQNANVIHTPCLLFYVERIHRNIDQMVEITGSPSRLRPHVKTIKNEDIVRLQLDAGISKFKCATLAEAEMLMGIGIKDILIAYPLVGPAQEYFVSLTKKHPSVKLAVLIDHINQIHLWDQQNQSIKFFIDVNVGMNRTGCHPEEAKHLFQKVQDSIQQFEQEQLEMKSLHHIPILHESYLY